MTNPDTAALVAALEAWASLVEAGYVVPQAGLVMRKAAEALRQQQGEWRDISTAPRDGTVFLGIDAGDLYPQPMKWQAYDDDDVEEVGQSGYWAYVETLIADVAGEADPSHWMPLPAPPPAPVKEAGND